MRREDTWDVVEHVNNDGQLEVPVRFMLSKIPRRKGWRPVKASIDTNRKPKKIIIYERIEP